MKLFSYKESKKIVVANPKCPAGEPLILVREDHGERHENGELLTITGDVENRSAISTKFLERPYLPTKEEVIGSLIENHCARQKCNNGEDCYLRRTKEG
jgi:hypothetical protein